ncbi:MAG TPA: pantoate--beta-alanine ligase, partial [Polyangiales bacterium]
MPQLIETARELFAFTEGERARGQRIGLVPTMGALHDGHMSLIDGLRANGATEIVVSIFVNPLQFAANEDLGKYPRTFAHDVSLCERRNVEVIYAPTADAMYPPGFQTKVEVEQVTQRWEGGVRPEHFRGVTTVVAKLFIATGPCTAAFGRKDYQQLRAVQQMARDLDMPVTVLGCPIMREPDGLAMSSRNRYLDDKERVRARAIHRGLRAASQAFARGEREASALVGLARAPLES